MSDEVDHAIEHRLAGGAHYRGVTPSTPHQVWAVRTT